jgi:hypothetical protein
MEVGGQLHAPAALAREIVAHYPLDRKLVWPRGYGEENIIPLLGIEPRAFSSWPVAIPTELSGLIVARLCTINLYNDTVF